MNRRQQNAALFHCLSLGMGHMEELETEYLHPNLPAARSMASRPWLSSHPEQDAQLVFDEIEAQDDSKFENTFRMNKAIFNELLEKIGPSIQGDISGPRRPIPAKYVYGASLKTVRGPA